MNNLKIKLLTKISLTNILCLTILLLSNLLSGCGILFPSPQPNYYYQNPNKDLSSIGRVALIEFYNDTVYPKVSADATEALFQSLQKKQFFGISVILQSDQNWKSLQLNFDDIYTVEKLYAMQKNLKCHAVLLGTVTEYQPYPHTTFGMRLKLIDLSDGKLIWGAEHIWDAADKTTEDRINRYFSRQMRPGSKTLRQQLVSDSPLKFIKFVTYEVAETLSLKR